MRNATSSFQILVYILSSQYEILHWSFTIRNSTSSFSDSSLHFIFAVRNSTLVSQCDIVSFAIRQHHSTSAIRYASLVILCKFLFSTSDTHEWSMMYCSKEKLLYLRGRKSIWRRTIVSTVSTCVKLKYVESRTAKIKWQLEVEKKKLSFGEDITP